MCIRDKGLSPQMTSSGGAPEKEQSCAGESHVGSSTVLYQVSGVDGQTSQTLPQSGL